MFLQRSWNKHTESKFKFAIVELCERSELFEAEKSWTTKFALENPGVFNIGEITEAVFGRTASTETKQKMSVARLGKKLRPLSFTDSHKEALSKAQKERFKNGKTKEEIAVLKCPITIDGTYFESSQEAAAALGVHQSTITEWKRKNGVTGIRGAVINRQLSQRWAKAA